MKKLALYCLLGLGGLPAMSQQSSYAPKLATTAMNLWKDSFLLPGDKVAKWRYDQGVILKGLESIWMNTGRGDYFSYLRRAMDFYVGEDGSIKGYKASEYNLDHLNNGRALLTLYKVTGKDKYWKAATRLRQQLLTHPRTAEGGFWHKQIYIQQMWLDGLYMAEPFYTEYAALAGEDSVFNDVARQFVLMEKNGLDPATGVLMHGWDASRNEAWANKTTGRSANVWGRSLGWYGMALVDVLDYFPASHPQRKMLIQILQRFAASAAKLQDPASGVWYNLAALPKEKGNYLEASGSSMLTYTLAKASRLGYIDPKYSVSATKGYAGILRQFIKTDSANGFKLSSTVAVSGLGGKPYRDGSVAYYLGEPVIDNDPKGLGAFLLCAAEMEYYHRKASGKTVAIDNYFNQETKNGPTGQPLRWHYTWDDRSNGGYQFLANLFQRKGSITTTLSEAPTAANLRNTQVYVMVDPDTTTETPNPHLIEASHINALEQWVKQGGTLVLLANDSLNCSFKGLNELAARFGIRFLADSKNRVRNDQFDQGLVVAKPNELFTRPWQMFIKEYSTLALAKPAIPVLTHQGHNVMAVARVGKGKVFALGDPWIYNEYIDGRKLPATFQNFEAADQWVGWLLGNGKN